MGRKKKEVENVLLEPTEELLEDVLEFEEVKEEIEDEDVNNNVDIVPNISSTDWTPFILSKLYPDEMYDGCPTYEGLRRLCYEYLGVILTTDIKVAQSPNRENDNHVCIVANMTIEHPYDYYWLDVAGKVINYSHAGDLCGGASEDVFAMSFPTATCTTRTKASLLRDAFRLKNTYAKEESLNTKQLQEYNKKELMTSSQARCLDMICSRINVDVPKFLISIWKREAPDAKSHSDLNVINRDIASKAMAAIQIWQQDVNKIDKDCIGYDKTWKNNLLCLRG